MNEKKIDLILKGINLLIIKDKDIGEDIRRDFNREFFDVFNPTNNKSAVEEQQERTQDFFEEEVKSKFGTRKR